MFGNIMLAIFLIVFGIVSIFAVAIPGWVLGIIAIIAGVLVLVGK